MSASLSYCHLLTRAGAAAGDRLGSELICVYLCITSSWPHPWNEAGWAWEDACHLVFRHGIEGIIDKVDTHLLIKLRKQEGDVCGNTVNEQVMDVEEHYGCCQECLLTLESPCWIQATFSPPWPWWLIFARYCHINKWLTNSLWLSKDVKIWNMEQNKR